MRHSLGIRDENFIRAKVPMTKREVRVAVLNEANIQENAVVIDVGSGTGSIAIEAALLATKGQVYALERKAEAVELIHKNAEKFNVIDRINIVKTIAPNGMKDLPKADAIIVGGSGGNLLEIIQEAKRLLKNDGRIVITAVTMETGFKAIESLKECGFEYYGYQMQINNFRKVANYHMLQPQSPIFILVGEDKRKGEE